MFSGKVLDVGIKEERRAVIVILQVSYFLAAHSLYRLQETIKAFYGTRAERFMKATMLLQPAYGYWVRDFMYGRILSRPGFIYTLGPSIVFLGAAATPKGGAKQ